MKTKYIISITIVAIIIVIASVVASGYLGSVSVSHPNAQKYGNVERCRSHISSTIT